MDEDRVHYSSHYDVLGLSQRQLIITCDRCEANIREQHYHCLVCDGDSGYDLCNQCAGEGVYCKDDSHSWTKRQLENGQLVAVGTKIAPNQTRALLSTMRQHPSKFRPPYPDDTPESLFANEHRFINKSNSREILIYTDGACSNNGQSNSKAGFAFVFRPSAYSETGTVTHTGTILAGLEIRGPSGQIHQQTSNRAELRAVIAAIQFCDWSTDCNRGWRSLVIATDSEYVAIGATKWTPRWVSSGWITTHGTVVKNIDLWQTLDEELCVLRCKGVNVSFWRIPRECNKRADLYAKMGVEHMSAKNFCVIEKAGPKDISFRPLD
ncbi:hypothetical protein BP5796_12967 [Coleophoma crateriformis]|uniref:ribonuclease H n=1 Tax=Coleophoma crateriformis TaxID=565419 RepID=A0A3D8Q5G0_9HELO|nr:hypothetical protein BP5796_12967 [Coleophoma crateriformis]